MNIETNASLRELSADEAADIEGGITWYQFGKICGSAVTDAFRAVFGGRSDGDLTNMPD